MDERTYTLTHSQLWSRFVDAFMDGRIVDSIPNGYERNRAHAEAKANRLIDALPATAAGLRVAGEGEVVVNRQALIEGITEGCVAGFMDLSDDDIRTLAGAVLQRLTAASSEAGKG